MAALTTRLATGAAGEIVTSSAGGSGDTFAITGAERFFVDNGNASACVVTFTAYGRNNDGELVDYEYTVPAGKVWLSPILNKRRLDDGTGTAHVSYSVTSTVTVAVIGGCA